MSVNTRRATLSSGQSPFALLYRGGAAERDGKRGFYHDNLIYLGSHRPLHAGPPLNSADHRGGKHHLLSVLKAATLSRSIPCSLPPEKLHSTGRMNTLVPQ